MEKSGRHPEKALTAARIRNARKPGRYADGNGLYLTVDQSGSKRWVRRTRVYGKRCDLGLGGLSLVGLAEARDEAVKWRKMARAGGDPITERRKERRVVPTFEAAAREVHQTHSASFRNPKHAMQWLKTLEDYAFPTFGSKRVDLVDSGDVLKALNPINGVLALRAAAVQGAVQLVLDVNEIGQVQNAVVVNGNPILTESAKIAAI